MKKLVSAVLAFVMLTSMFTTASAATMGDMLDRYSIANPFDIGTLAVKVSAKKTGDQAYSADGLKLLTSKESGEAAGVDYLAELDMDPIKSLFNKAFISVVLGDAQAEAEFYAGTVDTNVSVTIAYPAEAVVEESALLSAGSINNPAFVEAGTRVLGTSGDDKTVTITYNNINDLTVADLVGENSTVLNDIAFTLDDAIKYNTDGYHRVTVSMEGSTTVTFAGSVQQVVEFEGGSSHIVSAAVDHVLRVIPAVPATCTTPGSTEGVICQSHVDYYCPTHNDTHDGYDCDVKGIHRPEPVESLKHKHSDGSFATVEVPGIAPTCTAKGLTAHWVCTLCKGDFATEEPAPSEVGSPAEYFDIAALGHSNVAFSGRAATCTMDGYNAGTECSRCGHKTGGGIIPATGHSIVVDSAIVPTCTTAGKTEGKHCENCSYTVAQVDIAALGHNFGSWEEVTPATESSTGLLRRTCQRSGCTVEETQVIPQLEPSHTCVANDALAVITPATCTTAGSKQNYCECGQPVGAPEVISATGHNMTEVPKTSGTCTVKGTIKHYKCSTCGNLYRDAQGKNTAHNIETSYDKKNHVDENGDRSEIVLPAVEKTCEADGWSEGKMCAYCNTVITKQTRISKSHDFEYVAAKAATCEEAGVIAHYHCKVCNKDFANNKKTELSIADYTIAPLGHKWGNVSITQAPTESAVGYGVKICGRDSSHRQNVEIAKLEHVHNETMYKLVRDKTCTEPGLKVKVYTCCNEEYVGADKEVSIPAAHVLVHQSAVAATCRKEGIAAHTYCAVCQKKFTDVTATTEITETTLAKLPHSMQFVSETVVGDVTEHIEECQYCEETMITKSSTPKAIIDHTDPQAEKIKGDREDSMTEKDNAEAEASNQVLKPESQLEVEETGLSEELDSKIQNKEQAVDEKVVLEIVATAVSKFVDESDNTIVYDQKKEIITETDDYFTVTINIPVSMRDKTDYRVYRMHEGAHTANDIITEIENSFGEKITSIDRVGHTIKIKVKRFSEYVLVAYTETQPEVDYSEPVETPVGGGGGIPTYTVKFNANGGIIVDSVKVMRGKLVTEPVTTRAGYVFDGWYEDSALTVPFDFNTPINKSFTLYAKWTKVEECRGTEEDKCPCLDFTDLDPTMWYHKGVDFVLNNNMMIGVAEGVFAPDLDVTRAMLVTVLWRREGKPAGAPTTFADLEEGLYYVEAVEWAAANGVVTGHSDKVFAPNDSITREQFAAIMYRYAKNKGYDVSVGENTNILSYTDADQISEYAISAIQYAVGSGLMTGRTESTINPKANTTRAEMATILYRFYTENK